MKMRGLTGFIIPVFVGACNSRCGSAEKFKAIRGHIIRLFDFRGFLGLLSASNVRSITFG